MRTRIKRPYFRNLQIDSLEARRCMTAVFLERALDGLPRDQTSNQIALGDLDRDGDQDLVIGIEFWRENLDGTGRFGDPQRFAPRDVTNNSLAEVQVADVDSDGDQDIVGRINPNEMVWFENRTGLGRFGPRQTLVKDGSSIYDLALADLNGDGRNELIFSMSGANGKGFIKVYARSETIGTFQPAQSLPISSFSFEVVDWDRDGDRDLFTGEGVLYNLAQEGWSAPTGPAPVGNFLVGDLEGDNTPDVVYYSQGFQRIQPGNDAATVLNTPYQEAPSTQSVKLVSMSDVDGDGDGDLIIRVYLPDVFSDYRLTNEGNGFRGPTALTKTKFGGPPYIILVEDLNGDGKAEGVSDLHVYALNSSPATLLYGRDGESPFGQKLADVDRDGDLDLLSSSLTTCGSQGESCNIKFHWNENLDGRGTYGSSRLIAPYPDTTFTSIPPINLIDIDNDGDLDALTLTSLQASTLSWAKNTDGHGTFLQQLASLKVPSDYIRAQPLDVDGDGDTDLVLKENWVENLSGEGFSSAKPLIPITNLQQIEWNDWDADGDLDLITQRRSLILEFHERTAINPPTFAAAVTIASPPPPGALGDPSLILTDLDSDGDSDVITIDFAGKYLRRNNGGELGPWEPILAGAQIFQGLRAIDLDTDQDIDLLSGFGSWFENTDGKGQLVQRNLPTNIYGDVGDMDGDGDQDFLSFYNWFENRSVGDVNNDGRFNSSDLVAVCAAGLFEYEVEGIANFLTGDWNGDKKFDSADLTFAFQFGKYTVD